MRRPQNFGWIGRPGAFRATLAAGNQLTGETMFRKKVDAREAATTCWFTIRERAQLALIRIYPDQFTAGQKLSEEDFFPIHAHLDFILLWIKITNLIAKDQDEIGKNEELSMLIFISEMCESYFLKDIINQAIISPSNLYPHSCLLNNILSPDHNEQYLSMLARDIFEDSLACDDELSQYKEICRQICTLTVGEYHTPITTEPPIASDLLSSVLTYSMFLKAHRVDRASYRKL